MVQLHAERCFELSVETVLPGRMPILLGHYQSHGASRRPFPDAIFRGAWTSEFGALNRLYVLWEYSQGQHQPHIGGGSARVESRSMDDLHKVVTDVERWPLESAFVPMQDLPPGGVWDLRLYDVSPFHVDDYLRELLAVMSVRTQYSLPFGVWRQRFGQQDRIVHLWPYKDLAHRNEVRASVAKEPEWKAFVDKAFAMLIKQRSSLLRRMDDFSIP